MGEGMAFAQGLVLLGVEGLSFQVDLTYLRTKTVQSHEAGEGGGGPSPSSLISHRQGYKYGVVRNRGHRVGGGEEGGAYCANKTRIMPAETQGFQETVPGIDLEVTAATLCAKHLLVVW